MSEGKIPRVTREGKVAIILSSGYGAGWYSWSRKEEMLFDPILVDMIERRVNPELFVEYCRERYPEDFMGNSIANLRVLWIPEGAEFQIQEYDGQESVRMREKEIWLKA